MVLGLVVEVRGMVVVLADENLVVTTLEDPTLEGGWVLLDLVDVPGKLVASVPLELADVAESDAELGCEFVLLVLGRIDDPMPLEGTLLLAGDVEEEDAGVLRELADN